MVCLALDNVACIFESQNYFSHFTTICEANLKARPTQRGQSQENSKVAKPEPQLTHLPYLQIFLVI